MKKKVVLHTVGLEVVGGVLLDGGGNEHVLRFLVLDEPENFLLELVS